MIGDFFKGLTKIFGSKSERDLKQINPLVGQINEIYAGLRNISDDELRGQTHILKQEIGEFLKDFDGEIEELQAKTESDETALEEKDTLFKAIDKLRKERDAQLEVVLMNILPRAFAVVKETARRLSENGSLEV